MPRSRRPRSISPSHPILQLRREAAPPKTAQAPRPYGRRLLSLRLLVLLPSRSLSVRLSRKAAIVEGCLDELAPLPPLLGVEATQRHRAHIVLEHGYPSSTRTRHHAPAANGVAAAARWKGPLEVGRPRTTAYRRIGTGLILWSRTHCLPPPAFGRGPGWNRGMRLGPTGLRWWFLRRVDFGETSGGSMSVGR